MDILTVGPSTVIGYTDSAYPVATLSPWGGWRGRVINGLRQQYDARPVGPNTQSTYPFWGSFWNTTGIASARVDVASVLGTYQPDVILLDVGLNDIITMTTLEMPPISMLDELVALLLDIHAELPGVPTYAGQLPPSTFSTNVSNMVGLFNEYLPSYVQVAREAGANVYAVPCMQGVTSAGLPDGTHPSDATYAAIAENWLRFLTTPIRPLL